MLHLDVLCVSYPFEQLSLDALEFCNLALFLIAFLFNFFQASLVVRRCSMDPFLLHLWHSILTLLLESFDHLDTGISVSSASSLWATHFYSVLNLDVLFQRILLIFKRFNLLFSLIDPHDYLLPHLLVRFRDFTNFLCLLLTMTQFVYKDLFINLFELQHLLSLLLRLTNFALDLFLFILKEVNAILYLLLVIS